MKEILLKKNKEKKAAKVWRRRCELFRSCCRWFRTGRVEAREPLLTDDVEFDRISRSPDEKITEIDGNSKLQDEKFVEDVEIDLISKLHVSIIHIIFNHINCTRDVVRTSVLSKRWKRVFNLYRSFDFDQRWFSRIEDREAQKKKFIEYVDITVAKRFAEVSSVDKFRFYADDVDASVMYCCLRSICLAKMKNVEELDIQVYGSKNNFPIFNLSSSVTVLNLVNSSLPGFRFKPNNGLERLKPNALKRISLKDAMFFDVDVMKRLEENCPFLEDLSLETCPMLSHLEISSLVMLRRIKIKDCEGVRRIRIAAINLESFWFHGKHYEEVELDLKGSENLRDLTLKGMAMCEFSAFLDSFSLLEILALHNCNSLKKLTIRSATLKRLTLIRCLRLKEVDIYAPKLYSFQYDASSPLLNVKIFGEPRETEFSQLTTFEEVDISQQNHHHHHHHLPTVN